MRHVSLLIGPQQQQQQHVISLDLPASTYPTSMLLTAQMKHRNVNRTGSREEAQKNRKEFVISMA